jgi:hypothetical protein
MPDAGTLDEQPNPGKLVTPTLRTDSEYEPQLMKLFALHRVATPYDVMNVFPGYFKYHNAVMRHLNRLHNQGYLKQQKYDDKSYVYHITNAGYERCRDPDINIDLIKVPYHYEEPTGRQAGHEMLITKTAIAICQYLERNPKVQLLDHGRFGLQNEPAFENLIPDYWYMISDANGMMIRFVEVYAGEESPTRIRSKFEEYDRWVQREQAHDWLIRQYQRHGATQPSPEYEVHCILESRSWKHTDAWKERMAMMQTFHVNPKMQGRVWTTTKEALDTAVAEGANINHPIWHRAKDFLGEVRRRWKSQPAGQRTRFMDQCMRQLDTYPLFA